MNKEEKIKILQDIIKINTVGDNEKEVADYLQKVLEGHGVSCEQVKYADNRHQLVATLKFAKTGKVLGLSGHMDVVPVGDVTKWTYPPFSGHIEGNKMYGRGTIDMKSGLVAAVISMIELKENNAQLSGTIKLLATVGEETSGIGAGQLVELGHCDDLDAMVIAEPVNLNLGVANRGAIWIRFTTHGKTAHASTPHMGVNAIESMIKLVQRFKEKFAFTGLKDELLGESTTSLDVFNAGKATNVVPDTCVAEFDMRTIPSQDHNQIITDIKEMLDDLAKKDDKFKADVEIINNLYPVYTDINDDFVQIANESIKKIIKGDFIIGGIPGYTDASQFVKAKKIPIIVIGPTPGELSHQLNEYVELDTFETCIEIYKEIAHKYLT